MSSLTFILFSFCPFNVIVMPKTFDYCSKKFAFEISTPVRTLLAYCDTQEEYRKWLNMLVMECGFLQPKRDSSMNEEEEEEEEEERGEKQKRRSNTTGGEAAGFIQLKRTTTNDDQQKDQGISGVRGENQHGETQEGVGVDISEAVPVTRPSLSQEVALTKGEETEGEETKGEETKGEETKGEEHKETKGEENKDNGGAAERERAMIDLQSALADHVRAKYETFAMSDDATKPAQKARVIVAMVKSKISMFDTFSESPLLVRQVADLRHLLEASIGRDVWSDGSLFRLEDNLIARAGLLIDLGLVEGEDVDKLLYA